MSINISTNTFRYFAKVEAYIEIKIKIIMCIVSRQDEHYMKLESKLLNPMCTIQFQQFSKMMLG